MAHCVVFIDDHGTPSVIGPFENMDLAIAYANEKSLHFDEKSRAKTRIGQLNPPSST